MGLNNEQARAVEQAFAAAERVAILTGGPGTGKTYTLKTILDQATASGWEVELAAPTGKAAKRAAELTGRAARTIHRLLAYHPERGFQCNEQNPLTARLVVVDEASMVDVELFEALLRGLSSTTRLLLVGDDNQLPSVGAGAVLRSLIGSGRVPVARLVQVMRQSERSWIHRNAQRINAGELPEIDNEACDDFLWAEVTEEEGGAAAIPSRIQRLLTETLPRYFPERPGTGRPYDPVTEVQVLAPQKNGSAGVNAICDALRERLNPGPRPELRLGGKGDDLEGATVYRLGDKVIQNRNNYDLGVFNGESGLVVGVTTNSLTVDFGLDDGPLTYDLRTMTREGGGRELLSAWALSVHKSQGSEWPVVVVVCHSTHSYMLTRQILYTAITRAQEKVFLIGDPKGLRRAVHNDSPIRRYTTLAEGVRGEL